MLFRRVEMERDVLRWERLFSQGKESALRLIITFFQFCSKHENIFFDIVCWTSGHLWKNNKKMKETYEKTQANRSCNCL